MTGRDWFFMVLYAVLALCLVTEALGLLFPAISYSRRIKTSLMILGAAGLLARAWQYGEVQ